MNGRGVEQFENDSLTLNDLANGLAKGLKNSSNEQTGEWSCEQTDEWSSVIHGFNHPITLH